MHFRILATLILFLGSALVECIKVNPGGAGNVVITATNTLNATNINNREATPSSYMQLEVINNFDSDNVNVYVTGLDTSGLVVLLQPDGSWNYPSTNSSTPVEITGDVALPLGPRNSTTWIQLPGYISSARIWFADGNLQFYTVAGEYGSSLVEPSAVNPNDPSANINWGFVELSYGSGIIFVNISYVDFVGLPLGITLEGGHGNQTALGLDARAVANICESLANQATVDGYPWYDLCMTDSNGTLIRVLSPTDYMSGQNTQFDDYWTDYVDRVWSHYQTTNLTMVTATDYGNVSCTVLSNDTLVCANDTRGYEKPNAIDIFGCNQGPFSLVATDNVVHQRIVPILCAAFQRSTLLLEV